MIVVGGVIPPGDFDELYAAGATAIYPPGTVIAEAATSLLHKLADRLGCQLTFDGRDELGRHRCRRPGNRDPCGKPGRPGQGDHPARIDPCRSS